MATRDQYVKTQTLPYLAAAALTAGRLVGIDGSGTISYAQTDATAIVAQGILSQDVAAGDYCSIYAEGSIVNVTLNANQSAGDELGTGLAAQSGKLINVTAAGAHVYATLIEDGTAGNNALAMIQNFEKGGTS